MKVYEIRVLSICLESFCNSIKADRDIITNHEIKEKKL